MPHNEALAARVRAALGSDRPIEEKKMFGGIAFMIDGKMVIGVDRDDLMLRCEKDETDAFLKLPGVRIFDLSGRPMKGWLLVGPEASKTPAGLRRWVSHALSQQPKPAATPKPTRRTSAKA